MNTPERSFSRAYLRSWERLLGFLGDAQDALGDLEKKQLDPARFDALQKALYRIEDEFVLFQKVREAEISTLSA